ncbi:MAG: RidA family protein [Woeseiaceae bacterium]|nr:RidA family protein [Woeseiaceae bacterium]
MSRYAVLVAAVLMAFIGLSRSTESAEVTKFNDGPLKDLGLPFSESVRVGDVLFLSGVLGMTDDGKVAPGGMAAEADQAMQNIADVLERRGLSMQDIVKCTVFLADISEWAAFNEVYKRYMKPPYPARSALGANGLAENARLEIECIAAYPEEPMKAPPQTPH